MDRRLARAVLGIDRSAGLNIPPSTNRIVNKVVREVIEKILRMIQRSLSGYPKMLGSGKWATDHLGIEILQISIFIGITLFFLRFSAKKRGRVVGFGGRVLGGLVEEQIDSGGSDEPPLGAEDRRWDQSSAPTLRKLGAGGLGPGFLKCFN